MFNQLGGEHFPPYKNHKNMKTQLKTATITPNAESIEEKVAKLIANNDPIDSVAPLIYTEKKDGVLPQYDPRTDRQEIALEAVDRITRSQEMARRFNAGEIDANGNEIKPETKE